MKKLIYVLMSVALLISCAVDNEDLTVDSQNFTKQLDDENTNMGTYKGVFTTLDAQYRATVEIKLLNANVSSIKDTYPSAVIRLHTGEVFIAYADTKIETEIDATELTFNSKEMSFDFSVDQNGRNAVVSNVFFMDKESDIIVIKDSSRAPVTPITGIWDCIVCNDHPKIGQGQAQNFNFIFSAPDGVGSITTQTTLGSFSTMGIGFQDTCSSNGTVSNCIIESGDGSTTTTGTTINGNPLTWEGTHSFNNEPSANGNDCSGVSGTWSWESLNYGVLSGYFQSDVACFTSLYDENFQAFDGSGFAPNPTTGQLDSDIFIVTGFNSGTLNYGGTQTSGDFARGIDVDGGVGSGGLYAFEQSSNGNRFIGVQPGSNDFTPGTFEIKVTNNTGGALRTLMISYDIFVNNDQNRSSTFNFSYSTDGTNFTPINSLDYVSPTSSDALGFVSTSRNATFDATVAAGGEIYLRFTGDDLSGSAARDEIGADNILLEGF